MIGLVSGNKLIFHMLDGVVSFTFSQMIGPYNGHTMVTSLATFRYDRPVSTTVLYHVQWEIDDMEIPIITE